MKNINGLAIFGACLTAAAGLFLMTSTAKKEQSSIERKTTAQRVQEGPRIVVTKPLSSAEDLSMVLVPSAFGEPLDT